MDAVRVFVGSDHAGFSLRKNLIERLRKKKRVVVDLGPATDAACDYPEFAAVVADAVRGTPGSLGILVCATGQGMAIAAGKVRGIRAVVPATVEAARLTRFDNDANILCLGSRILSESEAFAIVDTWLTTSFAGGRHARRIAKVAAIETASALTFVTESEWLRLHDRSVPARLFDRDPTLLSTSAAEHTAIKDGLGWVCLPADMTASLSEINDFAVEVRRLPLKDLVILVDDATASPAAVMARACAGSSPRLHVVAAANGDSITALAERVRRNTTFVLVVSKPGADRGIASAEQTLWSGVLHRCGGDEAKAGRHFAAIATADSALLDLDHIQRYRKVFRDRAGVMSGFAILGYEGLVPAALLGQDTARLLTRAAAMVEACRAPQLEDNPGASLGVLLGSLAKHGRRKLKLLLSKSLQSIGPWVAHLLASGTRNSPGEIVTSHTEPLLPSYPPEHIFVHVQAKNDPSPVTPEEIESLHRAGQPYIQILMANRHDLAAELFRWQIATTVAALVMGTNPFASSARGPTG
jgi:ribose 5-phosphate isomerase B